MKIRIMNDGPNNKSDQTVSVSVRKTPSSHQSLDPHGVLTLSIEGEVNLKFDISGDIQPVAESLTNMSIAIQATASAKKTGNGQGRIVVKGSNWDFTVNVSVGGNVSIGVVFDDLG